MFVKLYNNLSPVLHQCTSRFVAFEEELKSVEFCSSSMYGETSTIDEEGRNGGQSRQEWPGRFV